MDRRPKGDITNNHYLRISSKIRPPEKGTFQSLKNKKAVTIFRGGFFCGPGALKTKFIATVRKNKMVRGVLSQFFTRFFESKNSLLTND